MMADSTFRYIRHADAARARDLGYILSPLSPPHGEYSCLGEWLCCCGKEPALMFQQPAPADLQAENMRLRGELAFAHNAVRILAMENKGLQERIQLHSEQLLDKMRQLAKLVKALP